MPVFRHGAEWSYFAHVPKCGGTSVERYLMGRFGQIGFYDKTVSLRRDTAWSRTSPQHMDWATLQTLLPPEFFAAVFAVVRHPVARAVSAYHFQIEVERTLAAETGFSDWLRTQARAFEADPFIMDNHFRPQVDFLPAEGCAVFHLEHGLEALIPYLDRLAGDEAGPRAIERANSRDDGKRRKSADPVAPTPEDLALMQEIYGADFARFGYAIDRPLPAAARPEVAVEILAARDAGQAAAGRTIGRLTSRIRRGLGY